MDTLWDWVNLGLAILGFIIGMWGIYLARKAQREGRELAEKNQEQITSLHTLSESLKNTVQTRAIGHFPENIRAIVDLIDHTNERLVIATDVASYGQLSNPDECVRYHAALVACAARNVKVEIIAYSGDRADAERRWQFTDYVKAGDEGFCKLVSEERWKNFSEKNGIANVNSCEDVFKSLTFADLKFRYGISQTPTIKVYDLPNPVDTLPVFFWLRDNEEAIFSLFTVGENGREISFRTIDQSITDILGETFTALKDSKKAVLTAPALNLTEYAYLLQKPQ